MPTKTKPTKIPTRTVVADDLAVEYDGVTYYPHAGESVTFRPHLVTVDDHMVQMRLVGLQAEVNELTHRDEDSFGIEDVRHLIAKTEELKELLAGSREKLAASIVTWTWTDNDGNAYPSPPTEDVLAGLGAEELAWLNAKLTPPKRSEEEQGNA